MTKLPSHNKKILLGSSLSLALIALVGWLGVYGLHGEEPRRALVSIEMMKTGEYFFPHMFGWMYYNKPPFFNWIMVGFFAIMGNFNEWAVRMPSIISLLLLSLVNWRIVKKYIDHQTAILSSLFILSGAELLFYGSLYSGEIDLFFTLIIYLQVIAIYIFLQNERYLFMFLVSYLLAGISFLTKGPPAIPFQVLTVGFVLIYFRKFRLLFSWQHLASILVFLAVAGGYLVVLASKNHETQFIVRQFKEASQRTGLESQIIDTILGSLLFPVKLLYMLLPWSLFVIMLFHKKVRRLLKQNRLIMFSVVFVVVNIPIYWFTGDFKGRYIYPFIPFICIILGFLATAGSDLKPRWNSWIEKILAVPFFLAPIAFVAVFFVPDLSSVSINIPLQIILILAALIMIGLYLRDKKHRLLLVVLLMFLIRIGMNNTYVEALKTETNEAYYMKQTAELIRQAGKDQIFLSGPPMRYESDFEMGPIKLEADSLITAPFIAFQIPYYLTLRTGDIVLYEPNMSVGKTYLIQERYIVNDSLEHLSSIHDYFTQHEWILVRKNTE